MYVPEYLFEGLMMDGKVPSLTNGGTYFHKNASNESVQIDHEKRLAEVLGSLEKGDASQEVAAAQLEELVVEGFQPAAAPFLCMCEKLSLSHERVWTICLDIAQNNKKNSAQAYLDSARAGVYLGRLHESAGMLEEAIRYYNTV
jgi:hypothetical protein